MEAKIREAILLGKLPANQRTFVTNWPDGRTDRKDDYVCKPADVIAWALTNAVHVPDEYRDWYHEITKAEKRGPKGGARDVNLYKVIAGLALANGYKPGQKQAQGWRDGIVRELDKKGVPIDADKVTDVIREAFMKLKLM